MTKTTTKLAAARAVVFSDGIAFAEGRGVPRVVQVPPPRFLASLRLARLDVVGHASQHRLIAAALAAGAEVHAYSAGALGLPDPTVAPEAAVYRMLGCALPSSLGGRHRLGPEHAGLLVDDAGVYRSPVIERMKFVRGLEPQWLARAMSYVVDPRWYVDPDRPDSPRRFLARLGLYPQRRLSMAAVAVRHCWVRGLAGARMPEFQNDPGAFVQRVYLKVFDVAGDQHRSALKASAVFAKFLRYVWLEHLSGSPPGSFGVDRLLDEPAGRGYKAFSQKAATSAVIDERRAA